jgi:predicted LPLAT superfamily acyltransferase
MSSVWLEQRERSNLAAMRLITWITRALGQRAGRALLYPICAYYLAFAPRARKASRQFLQRVSGAPVGIPEVFRHFHVFARTLLDRIAMLSGDTSRFDLRVHGLPIVEAQLARGRGCLLLGSHLGSVEILRAFGERHQKLVINLVMHEGNARSTSRWLRQMAPELARRIIAPGEPGTLLRVRECLERGEVVAMLGDRAFGSERSTRCEFLGTGARFPSGPMLTAAVLGVPVVAFFCLHEGEQRYGVHFELIAERIEPGADDRNAAVAPWIARFVERLEAHARLAPHNWFNFYDFWQEE